MDIQRQINFDTPDTIAQHVGAEFAVPAEQLFTFLTTEEHLSNWFAPVRVSEFTYEIEGNASGRIESCTDNSFLVTWEFDGSVSYLNVEVTALDDHRSALNAGFSTPTESLDSGHWETYGPGASGVGWDLSLLGLERYSRGLSKEPAPEEYADFVANSARAWGMADAASGTASTDAEQRAENTRRFYTGETGENDQEN